MRFLSRLFLLFFIVFQFSSTILYLIEDSSKNPISIGLMDEDQRDLEDTISIKYFLSNIPYNTVFFSNVFCSKFQSTYIFKEYRVVASIVIPPPKEV